MQAQASAADRPIQLDEALVLFPVRTPTLPPATHTNAYVLGEAEFLLVEPASPDPDEQSALGSFIEARIGRGARCVGIVLTHHHPDHVGGLDAIRTRLQAPLMAHRETARRLGGEARFDRLLEEGDTIALWRGAGRREQVVEVHHTPGHAPGHVCLVDRDAAAGIVGDMVASVGTILIDPSDGDMREYLDSLRRMHEFGMRTMLPAHGAPLTDPDAVLDRYVAHRLMREAKVVQALQEHGRPARVHELLPRAYDDTPLFLYPLAARSLESHLRKLLQEERAVLIEPGVYALSSDRDGA